MRFPRVLLLLACCLAAMLVMVCPRTFAQTTDYSKSVSQFPNVVGPYIPRRVAEPSFANSARIDQLMKDGKIYLSLNDTIALALENNLDLAIARYNLPIADTDILRARSGAATRGVNTGLVQGTPGGGVGTIGAGGVGVTTTGAGAGGTAGGAGGAGAGAAGLVTSALGAGPPIGSYDPILTANLSIEHLTSPNASPFSGATSLQQNFGTANFSWNQSLPSGTTFSVGFNNQRQTTNSTFTELSPLISTGMRITFTQHLLQGLSVNANRRFISIAKNNREISDVAFRSQAINTVAQIENIYWDLVSAYDDVRVKERSLALAEKTLSDNKKQVEIGTLAPIEVTRAQSAVASGQQDLIISQTNLQLQQLLMKNALTRNMSDPQLAAAPIIPTSSMELPKQEPVVPIQDLINDALQHSPDLAQSRIDLTNRDITKRATRNELLPTVDLVAWYGSAGLAGNTNPLALCTTPGQIACVTPPGPPPSGFGDAFTNLFGYNAPDYAVGLNVNIPIRNRAAQADQVRSELEYRQAQVRLQQLQNQIAIQVRNANFSVQQNRARVDAAISARQLAAESLDAEQKKYALGASTNTLVLQAQRDLAQAEANVVIGMSVYEKSKVELDRVMGLTLDHNGISIADAESGKVTRMPNVPSILPRPEEKQPPK
ncbi:MAG TPA: TolC family protein [Terriglobales bacterium]|jgi:outer membrane protein TolC|nr:TolC family protein [Terriglobales bacterium]